MIKLTPKARHIGKMWQSQRLSESCSYVSTFWVSLIEPCRLFDKNFDGYIDKKEFKWMTTSEIISNRTINTVFEASRG